MDILTLAAAKSMAGGVSSWNDLTDKPFGEETTTVGGDTLTWDGNTEGLESANLGFPVPYYRISENSIPFSEVDGVECTSVFANEENKFIPQIMTDGVWFDGTGSFIVVGEPLDLGGMILPVGVWTGKEDGGVNHLESLTIPGYTGFVTTTTELKTIETKFLPEHLQFGEEKAFEPIVWDSTMTGLEEFSPEQLMGGRFFKMGEYFQLENAADVEGIIVRMTMGGQPMEQAQQGGASIMEHGWSCGDAFVVASDGNLEMTGGMLEGIVFPNGIWFMDVAAATGAEQASLTLNPSTTTKPLDEKYMPILTSPSGKKFKISVDDSGTITATEQ